MDWDARYRSGERGPVDPHPLVVEASRRIAPGRALDLACGAGRNTHFLSMLGWRVTAVDLSAAALELVHEPRRVLADLERDPPPFHDNLFDLILIINFTHRPLFAHAQRLLRRGGGIAAAIRTSGHYSLSRDELRGFFRGWRIEIDREGEIFAMRA